jgi:D-sedoheptulose 7-phosphate isomerase
MRNLLLNSADECIRAQALLKTIYAIDFMEDTANMLVDCYRRGGKVILAGNGGSLCDASHFAEELTGFFRKKRKPLSAIALSDPGHLTCVGNDLSFDEVFARGVQAHGRTGDVFIGLSTSGNSKNVIRAFEEAKSLDLKTVAFLGKGGGKLFGKGDLEFIVDGFATSDRIQEVHMAAIHMIIEAVESALFAPDGALCI